MQTWTSYLVVAIGAGIGGALRHGVNRVAAPFTATFPWSTLTVNVSGSLAMGLLAGWFAFRGDGDQATRLFLTTGFLGGFTTFSAFSLDAVLLWERGRLGTAVIYGFASVVLSVAALLAGLSVLRR